MEFGLNEDQEAFRGAVRTFAREKLAPGYLERAKSERFPWDAYREVAGLGVFGLLAGPVFSPLDQEDYLAAGLVVEELAYADFFRADGAWSDARGTNLFDSGAPFYDAYQAADGTFVSVGAIELKFYDALVDALGLDRDQMYPQHDRARWPARKELIASVFKTRTRAEWAELMAGRDACFAPVLAMGEAPAHPHNRERGSFVDVGGDLQPAPAPRFSRTPAAVRRHPGAPGGIAQASGRSSVTVEGHSHLPAGLGSALHRGPAPQQRPGVDARLDQDVPGMLAGQAQPRRDQARGAGEPRRRPGLRHPVDVDECLGAVRCSSARPSVRVRTGPTSSTRRPASGPFGGWSGRFCSGDVIAGPSPLSALRVSCYKFM
jgi:hypothetical protein